MSIIVGNLIENVAFKFGDEITYDGSWTVTTDGSRIDEARWLQFLENAIRTLVLVRPDSSTERAASVLTGATARQDLPSAALRLISIDRNMGSDGLTPGDSITPVKKEHFDNAQFEWQNATAKSYIDNYMYDLKTPYEFWVNPQPTTSPAVYVEMIYSVLPTIPTAATETLWARDIFWTPLVHWMLYEAYSIDDEAVNVELAIHHHHGFFSSLGQEIQAATTVSPTDKE